MQRITSGGDVEQCWNESKCLFSNVSYSRQDIFNFAFAQLILQNRAHQSMNKIGILAILIIIIDNCLHRHAVGFHGMILCLITGVKLKPGVFSQANLLVGGSTFVSVGVGSQNRTQGCPFTLPWVHQAPSSVLHPTCMTEMMELGCRREVQPQSTPTCVLPTQGVGRKSTGTPGRCPLGGGRRGLEAPAVF